MKRITWLRLPMILTAFVALLGIAGSTATAGAQEDTDDPTAVEAGMVIYAASCAGCHGAEGEGSERGRPLTDIADQGARSVHIMSVTEGKGGMPAFAEGLSDDEISQAVSYVRLTFVSDDTQALQELPRTGATGWIGALGAALVALGFAVALIPRRRFNEAKNSN